MAKHRLSFYGLQKLFEVLLNLSHERVGLLRLVWRSVEQRVPGLPVAQILDRELLDGGIHLQGAHSYHFGLVVEATVGHEEVVEQLLRVVEEHLALVSLDDLDVVLQLVEEELGNVDVEVVAYELEDAGLGVEDLLGVGLDHALLEGERRLVDELGVGKHLLPLLSKLVARAPLLTVVAGGLVDSGAEEQEEFDVAVDVPAEDVDVLGREEEAGGHVDVPVELAEGDLV